jgi:hypothetical protein
MMILLPWILLQMLRLLLLWLMFKLLGNNCALLRELLLDWQNYHQDHQIIVVTYLLLTQGTFPTSHLL